MSRTHPQIAAVVSTARPLHPRQHPAGDTAV